MSGGVRDDGTGAGRHARVRDLFLELLELSPGEREAALDERCGGDAEIRREVLSLLGHHDEDDRAATGRVAPGRAASGSSSPTPASGRAAAGSRARFETGQIFAGRYRMVTELGRGGMGEVYRAHDLVLDEPVAIKLLPQSAPHHLDQLLNEVRMARQVTHPNVCRVYDFGEADGETYLTMEYVDGENLASLLARIGRFPHDKLLDVAHQLCAGLAAAHARGVLHRDLKPANVMIDGRGQVRITDFGIAAEAPDPDAAPAEPPSGRRAPVVGTPAYMAPEQLAAGPATVRSDLYALGLVLHEMATGRPVFSATTPAEYAELHRTVAPTPPSLQVEPLDPRLEAVILRCLEKDPRDRPASAAEVAAALPGADPLALALAAGQTPSPEVVAAARTGEELRPAVAAALVGGLLALLAGVWLLADRAYPDRRIWARSSPDVMLHTTERLLGTLGHGTAATGGDRAWGFYPGGEDDVGGPREELFWYRRSPEEMVPTHFFTLFFPQVDFDDPPLVEPGMLRALVDARGKLLFLQEVPEEGAGARDSEDSTTTAGVLPEPSGTIDWTPLLAAAGFDAAELEPAPLGVPPPVYADRRAAWTAGNRHLRAAAHDGRVVYFKVETDDDSAGSSALDWDLLWSWYLSLQDVFWLILALGAIVLARVNLRAGRGDRRGARRLAAFMVALHAAVWIARTDFLPRLDDLSRWQLTCGAILVEALIAWLAYVALEPVVRRWWPRALVAWSRLLNGRPRDPLVGRSLLIGTVAGTSWVLLTELDRLATFWAGLSPAPEIFVSLHLETARSGRMAFAELLGSAIEAVYVGVLMLFFLVALRVICKRWGVAVAIFVLSNGVLEVLEGIHPAVSWLTLGLGIAGGTAFVLMRFGLLAFVTAQFCYLSLLAAPVTLDSSAWYAETGVFFLLVVAAIGAFGCWTALAGRPFATAIVPLPPAEVERGGPNAET